MELLFDLSVFDVILLVLLPVAVIDHIVRYVRDGRESRKTLESASRLAEEFEALCQKAKQRGTS